MCICIVCAGCCGRTNVPAHSAPHDGLINMYTSSDRQHVCAHETSTKDMPLLHTCDRRGTDQQMLDYCRHPTTHTNERHARTPTYDATLNNVLSVCEHLLSCTRAPHTNQVVTFTPPLRPVSLIAFLLVCVPRTGRRPASGRARLNTFFSSTRTRLSIRGDGGNLR
jgi:hypothetical protein